MSERTVRQTSMISAPLDAVWRRVTTFEGINDELMPVMRIAGAGRPSGHLDGHRAARGAAGQVEPVVRELFAHRHRRLARHFADG